MTKTNYKKLIETKGEGLKIIKVDDKEATDKTNGSIIKYKSAKFIYEHPQENGNKIRAAPAFSTPSLTFPNGIKFNNNNRLTAMAVFDQEDEDTQLFISNKTKTQFEGWVSNVDVKVFIKDGKTYVKAKRDGELRSQPDGEDNICEFVKDDVMLVDGNKDLEDESTWYLVSHGGQEGFLSTIANKIAELLQNHKGCGHNGKTFDQIRSMIYKDKGYKDKGSDNIYWPIDKESGEPIEGKNPSLFITCSYFPAKEGQKENYVKLLVPGQKEPLSLEVMKKCSLKVKSAVLKLVDVFISGDKIVPHLYLTEATVIDIDEIKFHDQLETEAEELAQDEDLVNKLAKQLKASKKFEAKETPTAPLDAGGEEGEGTDFNALIKNEPVKGQKTDFEEPTLDEDVEIPGMPDE